MYTHMPLILTTPYLNKMSLISTIFLKICQDKGYFSIRMTPYLEKMSLILTRFWKHPCQDKGHIIRYNLCSKISGTHFLSSKIRSFLTVIVYILLYCGRANNLKNQSLPTGLGFFSVSSRPKLHYNNSQITCCAAKIEFLSENFVPFTECWIAAAH